MPVKNRTGYKRLIAIKNFEVKASVCVFANLTFILIYNTIKIVKLKLKLKLELSIKEVITMFLANNYVKLLLFCGSISLLCAMERSDVEMGQSLDTSEETWSCLSDDETIFGQASMEDSFSDSDKIFSCDRYTNEEFHEAVDKGDEATTALLLELGAQVDGKDTDGGTPLMIASEYGHSNLVEILLKAGAEVNLADKHGFTSLIEALVNDHAQIVELLLKAGADVNHNSQGNVTPLMFASVKGNLAMAELLIGYGADVNAKNSQGVTPLIIATNNGHKALVELFLASGANVNGQDNFLCSALLFATAKGRPDMICLLLDHHADINAITIGGYTALIAATNLGYTEIVELLLSRGANVNCKTNSGNSAWSIANKKGFRTIADLLDVYLLNQFGQLDDDSASLILEQLSQDAQSSDALDDESASLILNQLRQVPTTAESFVKPAKKPTTSKRKRAALSPTDSDNDLSFNPDDDSDFDSDNDLGYELEVPKEKATKQTPRKSKVAKVQSQAGERPFKCDQCNYAARTRANLKTHEKGKHSGQTFHCVMPDCQYQTTWYHNLASHVRRVHNDQ